MPKPQTLEDFEHEIKGCPENSQCDQVMGHQLLRWQKLIKELKTQGASDLIKVSKLEKFRQEYGIPVEFYTTKKSQQGFRPLYFNSHCKVHNQKNKEKILKGTAFIKSIGPKKALVWRDQTQIEVPTEKLLVPQPVVVYYPDETKTYFLPLGDQPLYIKDKKLSIIKEDDELFYNLTIDKKWNWKIEKLDFTQVGKFEAKKENADCPKDETTKTSPYFTESFCKKIWDETAKDLVVIKLHQGCV